MTETAAGARATPPGPRVRWVEAPDVLSALEVATWIPGYSEDDLVTAQSLLGLQRVFVALVVHDPDLKEEV